MNSSEIAVNGELQHLKTEVYDIDGQSPPSGFLKSVSSVSSSQLLNVNFNNNLTVNCINKTTNTNDSINNLSPKLESLYPLSSSSSSPPADRMPIPAAGEMQSTAIAGTTPVQHSISPSLPLQPPGSIQSSSQQAPPHVPPAIPNGNSPNDQLLNTRRMTSILGGYGLVAPGILGPLDHYRLQLYSYAMNVERLRGCGAPQQYPGQLYSSGYPGSPTGPVVGNGPYAPTRFALSMGLFPNRMFQPEEPKPQHSYIGLIAMAILSSPESKLVLSDIYQYILDNYPYFRTRGPGWRNSIRHNLSLNDCFIKAGRSANGKGHYWAIHPANMDDFRKGDFRRRKAQRKVRKHMGLAVDDEGTDSPSPPPLAVTPPPMAPPPHPGVLLVGTPYANSHHSNHQHYSNPLSSVIIGSGGNESSTTTAAGVIANLYSQTRKRQFDVASLLAPDDTPDRTDRTDRNHLHHHHHHHHHHQNSSYKGHLPLISKQRITLVEDEDIDVVASDVDDEQEHILRVDEESYHHRHQSNNHQNQHHHSLDVNVNNLHPSHTPPPPSATPLELSNRHHYQNLSPVNQQESPAADGSPLQANNSNNLNPTATNWQGLIQHWPNEFGTAAAAAAAAAMDPRIFGRYYSQYMAAAAARRVAGVFPAAAAAAAAAAVIGQQQNTGTKQQSVHQHSSSSSSFSFSSSSSSSLILQQKQQQPHHQQQSYHQQQHQHQQQQQQQHQQPYEC